MALRYDRDSQLQNLALVAVGWTLTFLCFGIPVFHLGLSVPVFKIALFWAISCALQLSVTPWMVRSSSPRNPNPGKMRQLAAGFGIWVTTNLFTLLVFIQFGKAAHWIATLCFDAIISVIFGAAIFVIGAFAIPRRV